VKQVRSEEIYEAMLDDDAFTNLPGLMAEAYGARSCVLHWRSAQGSAQVMAHNGYYPDEEMANYAENYTDTDLWALGGLRPDRVNQVLNCDDLVSPNTYEKSVFYNEWIRGMGDDTFHCLGTAVQTKWGYGFVGLHRGRSQGTFTAAKVRSMQRDIVHLRRMMSIRATLAAGLERTSRAEAVCDSIGDALITVTEAGRIVRANAAADNLLLRNDGLGAAKNVLFAHTSAGDRALRNAISAAARLSNSAATAVAVPRREGGHYTLTVAAVRRAAGPTLVLVTVRDPEFVDRSIEPRLTTIYGLSRAEADIAVRLSDGAGPADMALERGVSVETVRSQLKAVTAKLGCRKQTEIVSIVKSLPVARPG
jgi:DNA-binding CsgD family transcriptional regulator